MARLPEAFTDEDADSLASLISEGHTPSAACRRLGLSYVTYRRWILRAITGDEPYWSFRTKMMNAMVDSHERAPVQGEVIVGRPPSNLTHEEQNELLDLLDEAERYDERTLRTLCRAMAISPTTVAAWLKRGGYQGVLMQGYHPVKIVASPYADFVSRIKLIEQRKVM